MRPSRAGWVLVGSEKVAGMDGPTRTTCLGYSVRPAGEAVFLKTSPWEG